MPQGGDGALHIDGAGRIASLNGAAAAALGIDAAAAVGLLPADLGRIMDDDGFGARLAYVLARGTAEAQTVTLRRFGERVRLSLAAVSLGVEGGHVVLLRAVRDTAETPDHPSGAAVRWWAAAAVVVVALAGVFAFAIPPEPVPMPGAAIAPAPGAMMMPGAPMSRAITVEPQSLVTRLTVVGTIEPGGTVNVVAPFDGTVREKHFEYGGRVERGERLLVMDTFDLEMRVREAQATFLKAERSAGDLRNWEGSPDVLRARRAMTAAEQSLADAQRRARETKVLLDRGIVPRVEYESAQQQARSQDLALATARQDLDNTLRRAGDDARRIAELELENARGRLEDLKGQLAAATVPAPVTGLVLRPSQAPKAGSQEPAQRVEDGSRTSRGQTLLSIADLEALTVVARIDEIDVNRVREGQGVAVTGDAFEDTLKGRIASVAAQATKEGGSRVATFDIRVRLDPMTDEQRRRVRVGMSAKLSAEVYANPAAIVVPPQAVLGTPAAPRVMVRDPATGAIQEVAVIIGDTTEDGIEIRSGLSPSDTVVLP